MQRVFHVPGRARLALEIAALVVSLAWLSGCTPSIGDACTLSTDCASDGTRECDTSEPNGYCTIVDCLANSCPDEAACVMFNPSVPGCGYSDRTPSRIGRAFCVAHCNTTADCRAGYVCENPRISPWNAVILDDDQIKHNCLPDPDYGVSISEDAGIVGDPDAAVCSVVSPLLLDAGTLLSTGDAGDAGADAGIHDAATD